MSSKRARVDSEEPFDGSTLETEVDQGLEEEVVRSVHLPLDVWLIVAQDLDPFALLQLSRTTKEMHAALTFKGTSRLIWKRSFEHLEMQPLKHEDWESPSLASFLYENRCSICGEEDVEVERSYNLQQIGCRTAGCLYEAAMSEDELLRTYPIVHPKALNCIPGVFPYNAYREQYFIVSQAGEMNYELLMSLSAETKEEQPAAFNRFIASKEELVSKIEKDAWTLESWWKTMVSRRKRDIKSRIESNLKGKYHIDVDHTIEDILDSYKNFLQIPLKVSDDEWNAVSTTLVGLVESSAIKKEEETMLESRLNVRLAFDLMVKAKLFPCFPIFTEMPIVKASWLRYRGATQQMIQREMEEQEAWVVRNGVESAQRWIQLSLLRIATERLAIIGQPLPADVVASLNPPGSSLPPVSFAGIKRFSSSTGYNAEDPATITKNKLTSLLNRYSMQAFFYAGGEPSGYLQAWTSRFDQMNSQDYEGPLFPQFNTYWYQVLQQVLDRAQVEDDSAKKVSAFLETLGPNFDCGACSIRNYSASSLLDHIKRNHFEQPDDVPQASLVIYREPDLAPNSAAVEAPRSRTRSGRV